MTLSLDTHTLLWWLEAPRLFSEAARKAIGDGKNAVHVRAVVLWEIIIKRALGKLDAPDDPEVATAAKRFLPPPITVPHVLAVRSLPDHHRDPFDRLLTAQARHEGCHLVSRTGRVALHGIPQIVARADGGQARRSPRGPEYPSLLGNKCHSCPERRGEGRSGRPGIFLRPER